jgi:Cu2+-containing amine oxidase
MKDKKELKKYNHIIDGKKPRSMGLLARNLMNILLYIREKENTNQFQVPIAELRAYLKLTTNDYKNRIEKAIYELSIPMELRDFKYALSSAIGT